MSTLLGLINIGAILMAVYKTFLNNGVAPDRYASTLFLALILAFIGIIVGLIGKIEDQKFHFFAYMARMKYIKRWNLMRNTREENVQEHSHMVAVVAHALCLISNRIYGNSISEKDVLACAVYHEAGEVITGDLPTPIKYFNSEIKNSYKQIEGFAEDTLTDMLPAEMKKDIEIKNMYATIKKHKVLGRLLAKHLFEVGRDNARTPMQWNNKMNAGFSDVTPWIKVNENKSFINVEDALANSDSIYHYYQKLIKLRKELTVIKDGKYQLLYPHHRHLFIYTRETEQEKLYVIVSFAKKTIRNPLKKKLANYELRLTNEANPQLNTLSPYEARVYYRAK